MSINGIHPPLGSTGILPGLGRGRVQEDAPSTAATPQTPVRSPEPTRGQAALSVEAPPGTDPALWKVLSTEERSFFARVRTMGPLTYGPGSATGGDATGALQGGRIDVRV